MRNIEYRISNIEYQRRRQRRGTALIEFVMCIPLFALIISLTFFLGWALANQQRVKVSARYKVWRDLRSSEEVTGGFLNDIFYQRRAESVGTYTDSGVAETLDDMVLVAHLTSRRAGDLADEAVRNYFPHGRRTEVSAEFTPGDGVWRRFQGPIEYRFGRAGVEWRRDEAGCHVPLRHQYLDVLDSNLRNVPAPAGKLAETVRGLYLQGW